MESSKYMHCSCSLIKFKKQNKKPTNFTGFHQLYLTFLNKTWSKLCSISNEMMISLSITLVTSPHRAGGGACSGSGTNISRMSSGIWLTYQSWLATVARTPDELGYLTCELYGIAVPSRSVRRPPTAWRTASGAHVSHFLQPLLANT